MDYILNYITQFSPFVQNLLASFVFLILSWFFQKVVKKSKAKGSEVLENFSRLDVVKHILHKEFVTSTDFQKSAFGASIALLMASRWIFRCGLILIFFFGVNSIMNGNWLYILASWFSFNSLYAGYDWVKDSSDPEAISHVSDEVREEVYAEFSIQQHEEIEN